MSVFDDTANRVNLAFWSFLEAIGFAFKVTGLFALLGGLVVVGEQTLSFMRDGYWPPKSLLLAIPDGAMAWIVVLGDMAGLTRQIMGFLAWAPLSAAALLAGVCIFLVGRILARDR